MPRGKQSGIAYGQRKQRGKSDTEQLIQIASYLRKKYKVNVKREPYLLFDINGKLTNILDYVNVGYVSSVFTIKNPDLLWLDKYGMWIIEVDGSVHDRKTEKTRKRNEMYLYNHIKLIVVNLSDIKELGLNIYDYIDDRILEIIRR